MLKKMLLIAVIAVIAAMAVTAVGCGANTTSSASASSGATTSEAGTEKTTTAEEAAEKAGLKVDEKGNVTDKNGKKVSVKDGKVTVEVDGKKVTVDTDTIKPSTTKTTSTSSKSSSSTASSKPTSSDTSSKTTSSSNTTSSKPTSSNTSSKPTATKPTQPTTSKPEATTKPTTPSTPTESKKWHEAVYEYIDHPAVTEKVWVVDKAAYTYEEPVYETQWRTICNDCGADITGNAVSHAGMELKNGGKGSYRAEPREVQTSTKTVTVPEQGHYEIKVIKEAWTEKKLVKEAGYY